MIKTVISGYGKMGHMVEAVLRSRGIEPVCATEVLAPRGYHLGRGVHRLHDSGCVQGQL